MCGMLANGKGTQQRRDSTQLGGQHISAPKPADVQGLHIYFTRIMLLILSQDQSIYNGILATEK